MFISVLLFQVVAIVWQILACICFALIIVLINRMGVTNLVEDQPNDHAARIASFALKVLAAKLT